MMERKTGEDWTPEHVRRLWTYWNSKPHMREENFSYQVGAGVINFLRLTGRLRGRALDYGSGLGYLLEHLLAQGLECSGAEFSQEAVALVNEKFKAHPRWRGARLVSGFPLPFDEAEFDVVTCTETLEHLSDELLAGVVSEMRRIVRPGGLVLFTTPHAEDLEQSMTYCPFCDAEYHRVQHVRSFTPETMTNLLTGHGLEVLFCRGVDFAEFGRYVTRPRLADASISTLREWLASRSDALLDRVSPRPFPGGRDFRRRAVAGPHLAAVATRAE